MHKQANTNRPATSEVSLEKHILDSIAIPTFAINTQHQITHWNRAIEEVTGYQATVMIGSKNQWEPFYRNPRPTLADLIIEGTEDHSIPERYTNKYQQFNVVDNKYEAEGFFPNMGMGEWLSFTAAPIVDENDNIIGAVETLIVISDRKHAEQKLLDSQHKYRELSTLDDLTQLYNARHFFVKVDEEISRSNRYNQSLSICMLDLDNFKKVNDTYGHQFGNTVLTEFANIIKRNIRQVDMAFRYGGEEFVILFPFVIAQNALTVVEKILTQLEHMDFKADNGDIVNITTSAGLATYRAKEGQDSFVKRADKAMYLSKSNGKNQISIDG